LRSKEKIIGWAASEHEEDCNGMGDVVEIFKWRWPEYRFLLFSTIACSISVSGQAIFLLNCRPTTQTPLDSTFT
jgi:hypothetical protein